ncbi:MAG TPA: DNA repair protein RecO [Tepidisphaeraceae bacterium]|jgi:DNA repair protein RecO (recombination protein O)|nr:DNA repair protein RecO [Tepidisphaeraceae bacterium]
MAMVSDRCICLRKVEYSESSQILTLFSRGHGLVRVIAKGAHRRTKQGASKFDGGVDLLDVGEAVFTFDPGREMETLTEWGLKDGHLGLRKTLRGMYLGLFAGELCSLLIEEHDPHPTLFDLLERTIGEMETERKEEAFLAFELDLLKETGYLPEMGGCVVCGAVGIGEFFSVGRGGIVCWNCEGGVGDRMEVDGRLVRLVQGILRLSAAEGGRLPRLTRVQCDPLNRMFARHVEQMVGRRLRLADYVLS